MTLIYATIQLALFTLQCIWILFVLDTVFASFSSHSLTHQNKTQKMKICPFIHLLYCTNENDTFQTNSCGLYLWLNWHNENALRISFYLRKCQYTIEILLRFVVIYRCCCCWMNRFQWALYSLHVCVIIIIVLGFNRKTNRLHNYRTPNYLTFKLFLSQWNVNIFRLRQTRLVASTKINK